MIRSPPDEDRCPLQEPVAPDDSEAIDRRHGSPDRAVDQRRRPRPRGGAMSAGSVPAGRGGSRRRRTRSVGDRRGPACAPDPSSDRDISNQLSAQISGGAGDGSFVAGSLARGSEVASVRPPDGRPSHLAPSRFRAVCSTAIERADRWLAGHPPTGVEQ